MDIRDGDLIIRGIECETDAVFTTEHWGAFNVTRAWKYAYQYGRTVNALLDISNVMCALLNCDLDMEHIFALMELSDEDLKAFTLLLYVELPDDTKMLIDGNHRLAENARRALQRGESHIELNAVVITLEEANQFRIRYFKRTEHGEEEIASGEMLKEMEGIYTQHDGGIRDERPRRLAS